MQLMTLCKKCKSDNRPEAKFCFKCGSPIEKPDEESDFYGKKSISEELGRFRERVKAAGRLSSLGTGVKVGLDCLVVGDAGTGKNWLSGKLSAILLQAGLVEAKVVKVDAADWSGWKSKLEENLKSAKNGVLVVTNAQKLLPDGASSNVCELDPLFSKMRTSAPGAMPVVLLLGLKRGFANYLDANPDVASLFECRFDLEPLDKNALCNICEDELRNRYMLSLSPSFHEKMLKRFDWLLRQGAAEGGGHIALQEAQEAGVGAVLRGSSEVSAEDVKGPVFEPRGEDQIWAELDGFVGLQPVKDEIHSIIDGIKDFSRLGEPMRLEDHYVFTGNPGTGKTTVARCFADILGALGVLPRGQFVEVAGKDLIADVIGGSERNVQEAVDKAMGGVLFIDEAYGLNDGKFGQAAIDKLLPILENRRGDFVCILAGYSREMRDFMKANSGLESRFNKVVDFPDYSPTELEEIFRKMASSKGYSLTDEASGKLSMVMQKMYDRRTDNFGNARDVRNLLASAEVRRRERLRGRSEDEIAAEGRVLSHGDIAGVDAGGEIRLEDVLKDLDALVGLEGVKRDIRRLAASVRREQMLAEAEGRTPNVVPEHYQFLGNPGTGKTTVARLMGRMLYSLGLIRRPDVLEVGRQDLVGRYQGDTAAMTKDAVMRAMGGVLFIDEAYSLNTGPGDSYGHECINTLVPLLENCQGKFVCICAGYTAEMETFLSANSGMRSRLTKKIKFEDYNPEELYEIFLLTCRKEGLVLGAGADSAARERLLEMYESRDAEFGNAREVRTFVRAVKNNLSERTMFLEHPDPLVLKTIEVEDMVC